MVTFDWKKISLAAVAAGVVGFILQMVEMPLWDILFPGMQAEYQTALFRPWTDPWMSYVFVHPLVYAFFMAILYSVFASALDGKDLVKKGATFGAYLFLLSIPGMLISYSSFNISAGMVMAWTLSGLVMIVVNGVIIAKVFGK